MNNEFSRPPRSLASGAPALTGAKVPDPGATSCTCAATFVTLYPVFDGSVRMGRTQGQVERSKAWARFEDVGKEGASSASLQKRASVGNPLIGLTSFAVFLRRLRPCRPFLWKIWGYQSYRRCETEIATCHLPARPLKTGRRCWSRIPPW